VSHCNTLQTLEHCNTHCITHCNTTIGRSKSQLVLS